ncbi:MAG: hypothetical protein WA949_12890 [Phormidesmis sp.]
MTDLLDRINATLDRVAIQQERNTRDIDTLLGAISTSEVAAREQAARVDRLIANSEETNKRFETLRLEAQADREEFRQSWNDAVTQIERDRIEARNQANADRTEHARRFDAQQETIQRLLLAIVDLSRDNNRLRDRVDDLEQAS